MGKFTKNLGARVHKGFDKGYCTICGEYGELTKDHVPPQACNNKHNTIAKLLTGSESKTQFQNGTSFKVLCKTCNSERLGGKYDRELAYLSDEITNSFSKTTKDC